MSDGQTILDPLYTILAHVSLYVVAVLDQRRNVKYHNMVHKVIPYYGLWYYFVNSIRIFV